MKRRLGSIFRIHFLIVACVSLQIQDGTIAGDSIRELLSLSKKLAAVREPPRVVGVQGASRSGVSPDPVGQDTLNDPKAKASSDGRAAASSSAASVAWQEQQVLNARFEKEWKEGQGRAAKALTTLLGGGESGRDSGVCRICVLTNDRTAAYNSVFIRATFHVLAKLVLETEIKL